MKKRKNQKKKQRSDSDEDDVNNELERLAEALQESSEARMKAESNSLKLEQRIEELRAVSEKAKLIMKDKFSAKIKLLMQQIEEQKSMIEEDDDNIINLKERIVELESGENTEESTIKMREFRDSRQLGRENISLRYKVDELTQHTKSIKDDFDECKKQLLEARSQIKLDQKQDLENALEKIQTLETDRVTLREELKKRFIERSKMTAKINKLQDRLGESIPLDDIDDDNININENGDNTTNNNKEINKQQAELNAAQKDEIEKLKKEISNLKEALRNATRPIVQAASISTITPTPVVAEPTVVSNNNVSSEVVDKLKSEKSELEEMLRKTDALMKRREEEITLVKNKAKEKLQEASKTITKLKEEYQKLREQYNRAKHSSSGVETELRSRAQQSLVKRKRILTHLTSSSHLLKQELNSIKTNIHSFESTLLSSMTPLITDALTKYSEQNQSALNDIRDKYMKEMKIRKQLFNQIQELKGNIRVYCRVRPMNDREKASEGDECITFPSTDELSIVNVEKKTSHVFEFEKVFRPAGTSQESVFTEISELVTSCLDGYNVCIFAYGQTGSGKTFTMQGPAENPGVNVRALAMLFNEAEQRKPDITYDINISLLEIYNEQIKDLLGDTSRQLKCVQGKDGQEVPDLTMVSVSTKEQVLDTLKFGSKNRHVTATNMNEVSSRSHLILSVYVVARNQLTHKETKAKLHLIDLAGSERVGRSGVEGVAMKEAQNINQSLSALGNCIHARANKADHVPYRDSTLTWLLKDSLEKNSKTLMFVQVSPMLKDAQESVCSLKFAARVREVELGKATKNEKKSKS